MSYTESRKKGGGKVNLERGRGRTLRDEAAGDWKEGAWIGRERRLEGT